MLLMSSFLTKSKAMTMLPEQSTTKQMLRARPVEPQKPVFGLFSFGVVKAALLVLAVRMEAEAGGGTSVGIITSGERSGVGGVNWSVLLSSRLTCGVSSSGWVWDWIKV